MASIKHLVDIDLNKNQLTNVKLQHISGNPSGASEAYEGRLFYDSDAQSVKFHNGSNFVALGTATGDITSVTITTDSGGGSAAQDDSGDAAFSLLGGDGIGITNSGVTITAAIDASQTTITSVKNASLVVGRDADNDIDFATDNNIIFRAGGADQIKLIDGALAPVTDNDVDLGTSSLEFKNAFFDGTVTSDAFAGPLTGDVTGNADTATALATARNIGGVSFDGTGNINLPGVNTAGNQNTSGTAAVATTVTITDNESDNEDNAIIFAAGGDVDGGNLGLESDGTLTYNPSTGKITATGFIGALTGNASTATKLAATKTINGTAFDGSSNITLGNDSVTNAMMADDAIDTAQLADGAVNTARLAADAVTGAKIADDAINSEHYTDGSIDTAHIAADAVTGAKIADNAINSEHYTDGSIDTAHVADNAITGDKLSDNITIAGNLTVSGTTTTVNSTTVSIADPIFEIGASGSDDNLDRGIKMKYNSSGAKIAFMGFDDSTGKFTMIPDATDTSSVFSGTAGTLVMSTFEGALTGNVTGNVSGTAATVTGAAQSNITSLGTLTTLTVDDITINGSTISDGGDLLIDVEGDLALDANGGDFKFLDNDTEFLRISNSSSDAVIRPVADAKDIIFQQRDGTEVARVEDNGTFNIADNKLAINGTAVTVTAAELNLLGGLSTLSGSNTGDESAASTSAAGIIELATADEARDASGTNKALTTSNIGERSHKATIGDNSTTAITVNHQLNSRDVIVQLYDASSYETLVAQVVRTDADNITVTFNTAPASNDVIVLTQRID